MRVKNQGMLDGIHDYLGEAFAPVLQRLAALEDRLAAMEAAPMHYEGPHEAGKTYSRGTFVSHGGSLWHCADKTATKPGDGPAWTLAVKCGRDGRDAK